MYRRPQISMYRLAGHDRTVELAFTFRTRLLKGPRGVNRAGDNRVAVVYGRSVRHQPQRVGLSHVLEDEDIITIVKK